VSIEYVDGWSAEWVSQHRTKDNPLSLPAIEPLYLFFQPVA